MAELDGLQKFCSEAPDRFFRNSDQILMNKLEPPRNCDLSDLSEEIWEKFQENKQTDVQFTNKINLWKRLNNHIKVQFY